MPTKLNKNKKIEKVKNEDLNVEDKTQNLDDQEDIMDDEMLDALYENCDHLLDTSFYNVDYDKEVFMELRKIIDTAFAKRNKSSEDDKNYDDLIFNLTTRCVEDSALQDFMGYAYKKGKYDFCLLNYEKYLKWTLLAGSNGNAFSLSKLQMYFSRELDEIFSMNKIDVVSDIFDIQDYRFVLVILKKLCDAMVRELQINAVELIKEPEVYQEQTDQIMRKYDKYKQEACKFVKNECELIIDAYDRYNNAIKLQNIEQAVESVEEKQEKNEQIDVEKEALKTTDSSNRFVKKAPSKKKFRWWHANIFISFNCNFV